ncbi:MAG: LysR family transcriptional regulator [Rhodocyclaceae bacterium]|nr:MAG: LysR family transcriptional regulator [Rhodocyclaceae bacterium]
MATHISLEQWRGLIAVVEAGGYAQAAEKLHKSQSTVTYAVQKIEAQLGVKVFEIQGRKAVLTATGQLLYRRARSLVGEAEEIERAAGALSAGWEAEIGLAAEILLPSYVSLEAMARFGEESPHTRIELIESVLGGTAEALFKGQADLAITPHVPQGFLGDVLMPLHIVPVASPDHPLHQLGRPLTYGDLRSHRHVVVRDTGAKRDKKAVSVEVEQRWSVSNLSTSIQAVCAGYGFSWYPDVIIRDELAQGLLKPLPLREGKERPECLYLIFADPDFAGPGVRRLAQIIREVVAEECGCRGGAAPT